MSKDKLAFEQTDREHPDDPERKKQRSLNKACRAPCRRAAQRKGETVDKLEDRQYSYRELRRMAEAGHAEAQNEVGIFLMAGAEGVAPDPAEAVEWFSKSAAQGVPQAMTCLGKAYSEGIGVPKDMETARSWLLKAAEMGHGGAMFSLGFLSRSTDEALLWYDKAIEAGDVEAMHVAAELYLGRFGGPRKPERAMQLYRMAAERSNSRSMYILASHLREGDLLPRDEKEAARWFDRSARAGFPIMKEDVEFIIRHLPDL